jgi:hypothetical protein
VTVTRTIDEACAARPTSTRTVKAPVPSVRDAADDAEREADAMAEQALLGGTPPAAPSSPLPDAARTPLAPPTEGRPLDPTMRHHFEARFGVDFARVRIHDDAAAHETTTRLGARAFTFGPHIVFGAGEYGGAGATARERLLAHELSHVVQQHGRPPVVQRKPVQPPSPAPQRPPKSWKDPLYRDTVQGLLRDELREFLEKRREEVAEESRMPAMPLQKFEGGGRAAKRLVTKRFARWIGSASLPEAEVKKRGHHEFKAKKNLFDMADEADRERLGEKVSPRDRARRLIDITHFARDIFRNYQIDVRREEDRAFIEETIRPVVEDLHAELALFDRFRVARTRPGPDDSIIFINLWPKPGPGMSEKGPGGLSRGERWRLWKTFKVLIHESLHVYSHPTFRSLPRATVEGITELLTRETYLDTASYLGDDAIRQEVEGAALPPPEPGLVPDYEPGEYGAYLAEADELVARLKNLDAVKAAYFDGRIELLGPSSTAPVKP